MAQAARKAKDKQSIPDKLYFKIGEVADLIGVKPYVLRYWETEFPDIAPGKSKSKQRLYKRKEVELIFQIKELLYEEKFTIEGARQQLKELGRKGKGREEKEGSRGVAKQIALPLAGQNPNVRQMLRSLKKKLQELAKLIEE